MSRADRVGELIKQEVSDIICRKISDPRIGFTSVTQVEIGADLMNATIHVSVLGSEKEKCDTIAGLSHASRFIRGELGDRLLLRDVPQIHFKLDESLEKGSRVFAIMNQLEKEKGNKKGSKKHEITIHELPKAERVRKGTHARSDKRNKSR
jgi:ribosome-binding factor A